MYLYLLGLLVLYYLYRWLRELPRVPNKGSKYVYITGCDSGFGNLLARHLDQQGFRVIASCFTEKGEEDLKKSCSSNLITAHLDVRSKDSVAKVAAMIKDKVGQQGVTVPSGPCDWLTIDDYRSLLEVNLVGVISVTLSVLPLIKKARGRVVNMASVAGRLSMSGGAYPVSKSGVEAFNDSLRLNMAPFGVKVVCIEPGFFKTNMSDPELLNNNFKRLWEKLPQQSPAMYLYLLGLLVLYYLYRWLRELPRVPNKGSKYVYITGCDSGFGNLLARHLDQQGFRVIASCFTEKGEEDLKKSCSSNLITAHLDVRSKDSVAKVAAMIKDKVGQQGLWAVVNNAGVSVPSAPCDWLTIDDYESMLQVNLNGVIAVTLSVLPLIKKARGRVVNVASVFGRVGATGGPYIVSKYGVEGFNDSLRINMKPFGVKVLCIEPGFFKTNVTDAAILSKNVQRLWDKLPQDVKDDYGPEYLPKALSFIPEKLAKMSDGDLMKVVHCMEHAVAAVRPRTRYSPGWDAKLFWLPLSYMPTCVIDYILTK
ncbi:unnamed protein product, partial [Tetraodon nigroviridis]